LRIAGASRVIAVDMVAAKEPLARQFGATDFIDATDTDTVKAIRNLLPFEKDGKRTGPFGAGGVNWAFECVGNARVLRNAIDVLDWGGNCVIVGVPAFDVEFSALVTFFTHVDRGLLGCRYGSSRPHRDIPLLVELYKQGRLMLDELVSATYPLDRFDTVVADLHDGKLARGVLQF